MKYNEALINQAIPLSNTRHSPNTRTVHHNSLPNMVYVHYALFRNVGIAWLRCDVAFLDFDHPHHHPIAQGLSHRVCIASKLGTNWSGYRFCVNSPLILECGSLRAFGSLTRETVIYFWWIYWQDPARWKDAAQWDCILALCFPAQPRKQWCQKLSISTCMTEKKWRFIWARQQQKIQMAGSLLMAETQSSVIFSKNICPRTLASVCWSPHHA